MTSRAGARPVPEVVFRLPDALADPDDDGKALDHLADYYGRPYLGAGAYDGAWFDSWDSLGTRHADVNRFTADDLLAVTFLSVQVPPGAARDLLHDRADEFTRLLVELGPDRDLAHEAEPLADDCAGWKVMAALRDLDGIHTTTASKLLARKRPRLRPIWDSVVIELTGTHDSQWEPLRQALRADDLALHDRLIRIRTDAGLPDEISVLRVLDVICWMEGKARGLGRRRA